jgi:hypothetical protein
MKYTTGVDGTQFRFGGIYRKSGLVGEISDRPRDTNIAPRDRHVRFVVSGKPTERDSRADVRWATLYHAGIRGEGSIPVPLPPPASRSRVFSARRCWQLSPALATILIWVPDFQTAELVHSSPNGPILSRALDSADSVRFSKFECFQRLMNSMKWGSANPLGQARASAFEIAISRFDSCRRMLGSLALRKNAAGIRRNACQWRAFGGGCRVSKVRFRPLRPQWPIVFGGQRENFRF